MSKRDFYFKSLTSSNEVKISTHTNHFENDEIITIKDEQYKLYKILPYRQETDHIKAIQRLVEEAVSYSMQHNMYDGYEMITVSIHTFDEILNILGDKPE